MKRLNNSKGRFSLPDDEKYTVSLPKNWSGVVKQAMLHVVSMSHFAMIHIRGWAANSINKRVRLQSKLEAANTRIVQLQEELRVKDQRMERISAHKRPRYSPTERMEILELRAVCGWSKAQTSRQFLVSENTIADWCKRLDDPNDSLLNLGEPVNKFPDFVRHVVRRIKTLNPTLGKKRIADLLCRAGLHLAITTVGRFINEFPADEPTPQTELLEEIVVEESETLQTRIVTAKYPHQVWHVDLTIIPTGRGFPSIPANITPRFEPRKRWPAESKCAEPQASLKDEPGKKFKLHISYYEGRKHLPIVELKAVA